jgi:CRP/FNR family transcriptional regulator, cyclic AMP receptor protein
MRRGTNDRTSAQAPRVRQVFDGIKGFSKGEGNTLASYAKGSIVFAQGEQATSLFYVHKGKLKLTALSKTGEEATVEVLGRGDVFGESCLTRQDRRITTATTLTKCSITRLTRDAVLDLLHKDPSFSEWLISHVITHRIRIEKALLDLI